ncbi:MAG: phage shock protein operon transcriptional activator [Candidatus Hydrogenedentes bacterium]|nr:phage shock protein operon transcriptional activator [Candidatus Hydrogenedentota bacterium]
MPSEARKEPLRTDIPARGGVQEALGQSEAFLAFQEQLSRVAQVERPVLIIGERGTGKELAATRLHFLSKRWREPFIALNCSALAATLIESELFGHEAGAFTGAVRRRTGRFEAAHEGSLFLDEIGNIPVETQEKILRVVEYGTFERVGSSDLISVDVRIFGATNTDLVALAEQGRFMRDLLDRLSFEVLVIPPLRERREDIMFLANHFAARMSFELGWAGVPQFTEEAAAHLENYPWPGNVRELKNVVERAVYRSDDNLITDSEIIFDPFHAQSGVLPHVTPVEAASAASVPPSEPVAHVPAFAADELLSKPFEAAITELEIRFLSQALQRAKFNQRKAAELLGLTYHQFRGLFRKHNAALKL